MHANFLLGSLSVSPDARAALGRMPLDLIARHAVNEHGKLYAHEVRANRAAMRHAGQIISRYPVDPTDTHSVNVLVVTTASWDSTSVHLENE